MKRKILIGILIAAGVSGGTFAFLSLLFPLPPAKPYSTVVLDRNGALLHGFLAGDGIWRLRTNPGEIPEALKQIIIEKEDRFFYYHPGINPVSVVRALVQNAVSGERASGASTITMQVARMLEPKERTYWNKLIEMFRAVQLEWTYSKDEILELYLSMIPMGGNIEGLKSASLIYYQKPLERLNIAQLIDLILIPNDPNGLRPDRHADELFRKRVSRLDAWRRSGILNGLDSVIIVGTPAEASRGQVPRLAPHVSLRLTSEFPMVDEIRSTIDSRIQRTAEDALSVHMMPWKRLGVRNGAVLIVNNRTREVLAYVGSENFADSVAHGEVDVIRALRSPGSAMKPFLYAVQMDNGTLTPRSVLLDTPYDAEGFYAENYDGTYSGTVYADDALRRSLNVPMIRLLQQIGVPEFVDRLGQVGFASLTAQRNRLGLSMIVGGCGVTLEELVGAYASLANGGRYERLRYRQTEKGPQQASREFCSPATAYMVTDILSTLQRPDLPNNFESSVNLPAVAFKTGTSYGRRDAWAIGYSSELTIGVWIGNASSEGNPALVGSKAAVPLLLRLFNSLSRGRDKWITRLPNDLGIREVCAASGLLPSPRCEHRISDFYNRSRTLNRVCTVEREYFVSPNGKVQYCLSCLGTNPYRVVVRSDYPPELLNFWIQTGRMVQKPPPHNPACSRLFAGEGPVIMSPTDRMTYYVVSQRQKIALLASSGVDVNQHLWYVDDRFVCRRKVGEKALVRLDGGDHTITCVDEKGRLASIRVTITMIP